MKRLILLYGLLVVLLLPAVHALGITLADIADDTVPQEIVYKTVDGLEMKLFVFKPDGFASSDTRPAVVCIHGGGWRGGNPQLFFPQARYYASRGAVSFSIQYRLVKDGITTVFDCLEDCKSAMRYIRQHAAELGIDSNKIAVLGDSAGGHLAACLGIITRFDNPEEDRSVSSEPNAMVLYNPVADLTVDRWVTLFKEGMGPLGDKPPKAQAHALSPLFQVHDLRPPAIVLHGVSDEVVPVDQAIGLSQELMTHQSRCDLVLLEDTGHAFVIVGYTAPDETVVRANREGDAFLVSAGILEGEPTLTVK